MSRKQLDAEKQILTAEDFYNSEWQPDPLRDYSDHQYWMAFAEAYAAFRFVTRVKE